MYLSLAYISLSSEKTTYLNVLLENLKRVFILFVLEVNTEKICI